ncbi:MAG: riboflavin synthase [Gemmatimonadota bacterium]|nr:riboflavin synthase [Gemmatimonadota bacterium]
MFTGLVTGIGTLRQIIPTDAGLKLEWSGPWDDLVAGESVAVDGACLTVETATLGGFTVHTIQTTLDRTRFGELLPGHRANLERALRASDRLGGHLVQGHVDGLGTVLATRLERDAWIIDVEVPSDLVPVCIPLGSITVDGVSLTIHSVPRPGMIQVSLIPFTLQHTTLGDRRSGDRVHLEGDTVAKYLRALAVPPAPAPAD